MYRVTGGPRSSSPEIPPKVGAAARAGAVPRPLPASGPSACQSDVIRYNTMVRADRGDPVTVPAM